jgi:hypothetical protein
MPTYADVNEQQNAFVLLKCFGSALTLGQGK